MTFEEFKHSLSDVDPPNLLTQALKGLWWDAKGDWTRAHECTQEDQSEAGSRVHAYLHRKEGDQGNAAYWYQRAGKHVFSGAFDEEWRGLVDELLKLSAGRSE